MVERLRRWRALLERDQAGFSRSELLGLIGELVTLERRLIPEFGVDTAVASWQGPFGTSHDFLLPGGARIEVKTIGWQDDHVRISSLSQLDLEAGPLTLAVVRVQIVAQGANDAISAPLLIERLRAALSTSIEAADSFEEALAAFGWHEHPRHHEVAVTIVRIDAHEVGDNFPRLTASMVPTGVSEVTYHALLPRAGYADWSGMHER